MTGLLASGAADDDTARAEVNSMVAPLETPASAGWATAPGASASAICLSLCNVLIAPSISSTMLGCCDLIGAPNRIGPARLDLSCHGAVLGLARNWRRRSLKKSAAKLTPLTFSVLRQFGRTPVARK